MIKGIAPSVLTDEDIAAQAAKAQEKKPRNIYIPPNLFAEFAEVDLENEDFFKYIAYQVLIQFMDRVTDLDWIVHFPENIPSTGRSYIHDCATFFGLHSHSQGSKKRCALVYPRHLFKDKIESEKKKKEKELAKLREKNAGAKIGFCAENPKTIRDKMIVMLYEETR